VTSPGIAPFPSPPCLRGGGAGRCRGPVSRRTLQYQAVVVDDFPPDLKRDQALPTRKKREPQSPTCVHSLGCRQAEDPPAWGRSDAELPSAVGTEGNPERHPQLRLPQPLAFPGHRGWLCPPSRVPPPARQVCRGGCPRGKRLTSGLGVDRENNHCYEHSGSDHRSGHDSSLPAGALKEKKVW